MTLWFSATAAAPRIAADLSLSDSATAWLTMAVQGGFVVGTLVSATLNLADVFNARRLFAAGCAGGALANAAIIDAGIAATVEAAEPMARLPAYARQDVLAHCVKRIQERLQAVSAGWGDAETGLMKQRLLSNSPALERFLLQVPRIHSLDRLLQQSGMSPMVTHFLGYTAMTVLGGMASAALLGLPFTVALLSGVAGVRVTSRPSGSGTGTNGSDMLGSAVHSSSTERASTLCR